MTFDLVFYVFKQIWGKIVLFYLDQVRLNHFRPEIKTCGI